MEVVGENLMEIDQDWIAMGRPHRRTAPRGVENLLDDVVIDLGDVVGGAIVGETTRTKQTYKTTAKVKSVRQTTPRPPTTINGGRRTSR